MIVLSLCTATPLCGVAVYDSTTGAAQVRRERVTTHSERLLLLIDECLRAHGTGKRALGGVVCGAGPGSFTGLRIGLATAKGLCFALGLPLVMVSTLEVLSAPVPGGRMALPCLHARQREVYARLFLPADQGGLGGLEQELAAAHPALLVESAWEPVALAEAVTAALGPLVSLLTLCGDGPARYPELNLPGAQVEQDPAPDPLHLARRGAALLLRGERLDLAAAAPNYVCPSAPERLALARQAAQSAEGAGTA